MTPLPRVALPSLALLIGLSVPSFAAPKCAGVPWGGDEVEIFDYSKGTCSKKPALPHYWDFLDHNSPTNYASWKQAGAKDYLFRESQYERYMKASDKPFAEYQENLKKIESALAGARSIKSPSEKRNFLVKADDEVYAARKGVEEAFGEKSPEVLNFKEQLKRLRSARDASTDAAAKADGKKMGDSNAHMQDSGSLKGAAAVGAAAGKGGGKRALDDMYDYNPRYKAGQAKSAADAERKAGANTADDGKAAVIGKDGKAGAGQLRDTSSAGDKYSKDTKAPPAPGETAGGVALSSAAKTMRANLPGDGSADKKEDKGIFDRFKDYMKGKECVVFSKWGNELGKPGAPAYDCDGGHVCAECFALDAHSAAGKCAYIKGLVTEGGSVGDRCKTSR